MARSGLARSSRANGIDTVTGDEPAPQYCALSAYPAGIRTRRPGQLEIEKLVAAKFTDGSLNSPS